MPDTVINIQKDYDDFKQEDLANSANVNRLINKKPAIEMICEHGEYDLLNEVLKNPNLNFEYKVAKTSRSDSSDPNSEVIIQCPLLVIVITNMIKRNTNEMDNYKNCFNRVLQLKDPIHVNLTDDKGNSPLHYTVKYKLDDLTKLLLEHGAYIGVMNSDKKLPIDGIKSQLLSEFFDAQITTLNGADQDDRSNFKIVLDYSFLIKKPNKYNKFSQNTDQFYPIKFICQTDNLKELILHPLIRYLIWSKTMGLWVISIWHLLVFLFLIATVIYLTFFNIYKNNSDHWMIKLCFLTPLLLKELFIIGTIIYSKCSKTGIADGKNWFSTLIELLYSYTFLTLLCFSFYISPNIFCKKSLSAACIVLIAFEINSLLLIVPKFKKMSVHYLMFKKITFQFIKVISFHSVTLVAFALALHVLEDKKEIEVNENKEFVQSAQLIARVLAMMVGELGINFDSILFVYYIGLIFFIFSITTVLINLLNGLAVMDVREIEKDAKLIYLQYRVNQILRYNNILSKFVLIRKILFRLSKFKYLKAQIKMTLSLYLSKITFCPETNITKFSNIFKLTDPEDTDDTEMNNVNKNLMGKIIEVLSHKKTNIPCELQYW